MNTDSQMKARPLNVEFLLPALRTVEQFVIVEGRPASYLKACALRLPIAIGATRDARKK